ncbi:hypothetical protein I8C63_003961 [Salmonella enterica]|nr:hypothetical protein [Salmonella enterica]EDG1349035.1 hypothetical protein [Salmonella enterica subsp. enterica serovar Newport]EFC7805308.1 hypothetical protein [Escherichia coli]EFQ0011549.1 hypothetical protein [Shigella flexneri]EFT3880720.1 hypothetical protein [Shigella sonnei]
MKLIIFILIVLIIAALLIRIILRSVNQHSPLLMQLHAAGIRTGDAERILSGGEYWQRQKTLLTERGRLRKRKIKHAKPVAEAVAA